MSMTLPSFRIDAGGLLQHVSRVAYRNEPLHFGCNGVNRYDAPKRDFGVLYLGRDLATALMESIFHQHRWLADATRLVMQQEIQRRMVRAVGVLEALCLADLTATGVMAGVFGLNLEQLVARDYAYTQQVSTQVHAMRKNGIPLFDGVLYPSRNNYPAQNVALFDRAGKKVKVIADIDLVEHVDWPRFVTDYRIAVASDLGLTHQIR
ncbi:MAG: RES family NAD+ phosphorylase [Pseudomonadales bacterium]|jgi:hypothetical protein|nr:RES family NAD+ phosphorylase [Pseudomonadales bacterium]